MSSKVPKFRTSPLRSRLQIEQSFLFEVGVGSYVRNDVPRCQTSPLFINLFYQFLRDQVKRIVQ